MPTPERCLAQAAEAERLAAIVSYERDRLRLLRQAQEWRERAVEVQAAPVPTEPLMTPALIERVRGWLRATTKR